MAGGPLKVSLVIALVLKSLANPADGSSAVRLTTPRLDVVSTQVYFEKSMPPATGKANEDNVGRNVLIPVQGAAMSIVLGALTEVPVVHEGMSILLGRPVPTARQLAQQLGKVLHWQISPPTSSLQETDRFTLAAHQARRRPASARGVAAMIGLFIAGMGVVNSRHRRSVEVSGSSPPRSTKKKKSVTVQSPGVSPRQSQPEGNDTVGGSPSSLSNQGKQGFVKASVEKIDSKVIDGSDSDGGDIEAVRAAFYKINTPGTSRAPSRAASKASAGWLATSDEEDTDGKDNLEVYKINTPGTSRAPSKASLAQARAASKSSSWWNSEQ